MEKTTLTESQDSGTQHDGPGMQSLAAAFENPLKRRTKEQLLSDVEVFCQKHQLTDFVDAFRQGALIAQNPNDDVLDVPGLSDNDKELIRREKTHRWSQPFTLYWLCIMCSVAAGVQGMDESVNNGAQALYLNDLRVTDDVRFSRSMQNYLTGLIVGAPYLCAALLGCWINEPLNHWLGRRGAIFVTCVIAAVTAVWQGVADTWVNLFLARFFLGFAIGPKSSTVPVYTAECAPAPIRGSLVMQWQVWTAFGVMLGNIMGVAFGPSTGIKESLGWRLMLGSTVVLPLVVCAQVFFCPESPRWYLKHNQAQKAFRSFQRLRFSDVQAARDTYYTYVGVELEREANKGKNVVSRFIELFTIPRNRRASLGAWIVMFAQQFCGVNIIAYYSTTIFIDANYSTNSALLASMGTGILNWVFAVPALFTIDRWGRRNLLLVTFPLMALALLWTGMSFFFNDDTTRIAMIITGTYLFEVFYSPGEGPVPFTYSAEVFPIQYRDLGMSFATATCWAFNFIISFAWPQMKDAFTSQGAFGWYAAWCIVLWFMILFYVPETKSLTLEELDHVFNVSTRKHARYQARNAIWHFRTWILRQKLDPMPPLYEISELNKS